MQPRVHLKLTPFRSGTHNTRPLRRGTRPVSLPSTIPADLTRNHGMMPTQTPTNDRNDSSRANPIIISSRSSSANCSITAIHPTHPSERYQDHTRWRSDRLTSSVPAPDLVPQRVESSP